MSMLSVDQIASAMPSGTVTNGSRKRVTTSQITTGNDDISTVQWAEEKLQDDKNNRTQFDNQWYMNLAFYSGRQYMTWSAPYATASGLYQRMYEPPAPPWRVRLVTNKIRAIIRKEHANLTKENPEPYVIPATTDDDDLLAARAAEACFEFLWRELHCRRKLRQAIWWTCLTGTGFLKTWFNPLAIDASGQMGSIEVDLVTPFHLYVPILDEQDIENQPHITQVTAKPVDWVKDTYGVDIEADSTTGTSTLDQKYLSALGLQSLTGIETVLVKEMWVKPCVMFPQGAVVIWAGDSTPLLIQDSLPYGHGEYPFTKFTHIPTGRFYGESTITDLIPLQKEYNRTRSQVIEAKNRMARPQLIAPKGSVDPNRITTEPGLIIFYTPGYTPPTALKMEPIPSYVMDDMQRCITDMADISFQHEVSKGHTPPGVTAATAISYLQEEDDSSLADTVASIEEGVEKIGKHFLEFIQEFWVNDRTVTIVGSDNAYESMVMSQTNIAGNTDLNIQAGSAMPRSRAAKQAFITQLGQMGWIPPDRALRYMDMAETGRLYEELQIDVRQAQRENLKMLNGEQVPVNTWDDHQQHVLEHNNERKKQKFENSPDQVKQLFEQHVQMHQMVMQQNMVQAQGGMGAGPGAPMVPGGPPGPGVPSGGPPPNLLHAPGGTAHAITQQVRMPFINPMQGAQGPP